MTDRAIADSLTRTLGELIAIPSTFPPGETRAIVKYAGDRLAAAGYRIEVTGRRIGVDNVVARLGSGRPSLVFNVHADTVGAGERTAWRSDPFVANVQDGRLYGLGACNCKGSMAVQLWLAEEVARAGGPKTGEIVFTMVGDEEGLGPDGTKFLRDSVAIGPTYLVVGAPTRNKLIVAERGVFWARVSASGRAAHAGQPEHGDNAIRRMMRIIAALERDLMPKLSLRLRGDMRSTMNIGTIHGGTTANVVPSRCTIEIDRRLLPEEKIDAALAELRAAIGTAGEPEGSWDIEFLTGTNGFAASADALLVGAFAAACERRTGAAPGFIVPIGASDARYFADDPVEILVTGPGDDKDGHAANESVSIAELVDAAHIHLDAVQRLLGLNR
jgi:acetylornithine deacetylase/succinyl-diaminopimelate desuccinylase family protein